MDQIITDYKSNLIQIKLVKYKKEKYNNIIKSTELVIDKIDISLKFLPKLVEEYAKILENIYTIKDRLNILILKDNYKNLDKLINYLQDNINNINILIISSIKSKKSFNKFLNIDNIYTLIK